jgi:hypothetical protein
MDHNMVFRYDYGKQKKGQQKTYALPLLAISMATVVHRSNTERHVQGYSGSHWMPPLGNYLLRIAPAATRATGKQITIKKYTYFAGHFDGRGGVPVQYRVHRPIEEVQSFTRSHWMPPSGKYCGR